MKEHWTRIYRGHLDLLKKAEIEALRSRNTASEEKQDACPYHVILDDPNIPEVLGTAKTEAEARKILIELARGEDALYKLEYEHFAIDWDNDGNGFWLQLWDGPDGYRASHSRYDTRVHIECRQEP